VSSSTRTEDESVPPSGYKSTTIGVLVQALWSAGGRISLWPSSSPSAHPPTHLRNGTRTSPSGGFDSRTFHQQQKVKTASNILKSFLWDLRLSRRRVWWDVGPCSLAEVNRSTDASSIWAMEMEKESTSKTSVNFHLNNFSWHSGMNTLSYTVLTASDY
jgi:hypothetical protein